MNDHAQVGDRNDPFGVPAGRIGDVTWLAPPSSASVLVKNQQS
jgi:hypothetical protein